MPMSDSMLAELITKELMPKFETERERLDRIDLWYRWKHEPIPLPRQATPEHRALAELSRVPWLGLVVTSCAQCMYVDGYRTIIDQIDAPTVPDAQPVGPWKIWLANGWDRRQIAVHRSMLAYGYSFATALPGEDFRGEPMPVIRGVSPRKMIALYEDAAEDDWPVYAMRVMDNPDKHDRRVKVYDDECVYTVIVKGGSVGNGRSPIEIQDTQKHGAGITPVVRYANELDLDGRTPGEVEPHIPLAARINKTSYDRLLTQHFNSWKVRTIAGMSEPDTEEEAARKSLRLRQGDMLIADDPDTKFGSLPETMLQGFIQAHQADVESLAAVSQTPTHELTGQLVNLSAEALAAARASQTMKVSERQKSAGASHSQLLRLAAGIAGEDDYAGDVTGRVTWQDMSIRSMAQAVDALGKAATMLGVPVTELWAKIPGVEKSDVEEWKRVKLEEDPLNRMQNELANQAGPSTTPVDNQVPAGQ